MNLLFADQLAPITSEFGFVEVSERILADWWFSREAALGSKRGVSVQRSEVTGRLDEMLLSLLPLTSVESRRVLTVATHSQWTAFFDNGWQGTDAAGLAVAAADLKCRAVRIVAVPDTIGTRREASSVGRFGARIFELYGPEQTNFLNYVRVISVANDGGRWRLDLSGQPLAGEDPSWFSARNVKDRFRPENLEALVKALGIDAFSDGFYDKRATLIERHGPVAPGLREYSLAEARASFAR